MQLIRCSIAPPVRSREPLKAPFPEGLRLRGCHVSGQGLNLVENA